ncbi:unnamed protein product [Orchesella dallaii]|uniref:SET domain-containing protein n=1 Tax=Orchesella dallaii TaxID=48710 RepID=A0ABP1PQS5_9HEXA
MDSLINIIYTSKFADSNLCQQLNETFTKAAGKIQINDNDHTVCPSVFERIQRAKLTFDWSQVSQHLLQHEGTFIKSLELSAKLREKGNELYQQRNGEAALRAYSLAIAFAPNATEELCMAYANRSAVLREIGKARESLEDVERVLKLGKLCPANLKDKLLERKGKCEAMLLEDNGTASEESSSSVDKLFHIQDPNSKVANAKSFVQIGYSKHKGRHLTVTKDVPAGAVLLVDQPFVSVLNKLLCWETDHCHNCFKYMLNGIPCLKCSFALFCSEKCLQTACNNNGVHRYEHNYLPILHALQASHAIIQSLRIMALVGPPALYKLFKSQDPLYFDAKQDDGSVKGFDKRGIYNVKSYLPVYHLISHAHHSASLERDFQTGWMNPLRALFLKELLKRYSSFFSDLSSKEDMSEFEDFIASLILQHLDNIRYNAISLSKLMNVPNSQQENSQQLKSVAFAAAVYPLISLCNHSCDPNCAPVKKSKHLVTSLVALQHLKEGDELFITYKPLYSQMRTSDRQKFLADNYQFICNCNACNGDWGPETGQLSPESEGVGTLILESTRCESCPPTESGDKKPRQCHECALKDVNLGKEIQKMETELFECHDLLKEGKYAESLEKLPAIVDFFGSNGFPSHFPLYSIALELFKRTLTHSVAKF